jgi:hypothetical protein
MTLLVTRLTSEGLQFDPGRGHIFYLFLGYFLYHARVKEKRKRKRKQHIQLLVDMLSGKENTREKGKKFHPCMEIKLLMLFACSHTRCLLSAVPTAPGVLKS